MNDMKTAEKHEDREVWSNAQLLSYSNIFLTLDCLPESEIMEYFKVNQSERILCIHSDPGICEAGHSN